MPGGRIPFQGGGLLHEFRPDTSVADRATVTTATWAVYANGTSGNDANTGLSAAQAKKTRAAALALVPDIVKHSGSVNFAGTFATAESINFAREVRDAMIVVTGENDWTIVDDNSGSKYTTTGASTSSLVVAGAGWTVNEHMGLFARILTGAAADEIVQVQKNDDDTITPLKNFAANPGVGATFELVQPKTLINVSSGTDLMRFTLTGFGTGVYNAGLVVQRLTTQGTKPEIRIEGCTVYTFLSHLCLRSTKNTPLWILHGAYGSTTDYAFDPATFDLVTPATSFGGVFVAGNSGPAFKANACLKLWLDALLVKTGAEIQNTNMLYLASGFWFVGATTFRALATDDSHGLRGNSSGYATGGMVNAAGSNLVLEGCPLVNVTAGNYGGAGAHGIEAISSYLRLDGAVAGAANTDAGVCAHTGSDVTITDDTPPTITGTAAGDFSFDGSNEASSWADIDAGTAVSDISEMSMCKEV
jgi:hypothetical protein